MLLQGHQAAGIHHGSATQNWDCTAGESMLIFVAQLEAQLHQGRVPFPGGR